MNNRAMALDISRIIESQYGIRLISILGQLIPRGLGYVLANYVAKRIAQQKDLPVVQAIRSNQWVVRGEVLGKESLDLAVLETLENIARSLFDMYHFINNPRGTSHLFNLDPSTRRLSQRPEFDSRGLVIAGLHMSNFDLSLQWLCKLGMTPLVLTLPNPEGGRKVEYEMRKSMGINLIPTSVIAIHRAIKYLQQGGLVLTGIDRPIPNPDAYPCFFGRPASLPVHHIYLAVKARVPVMIMAANLQEDGKYHFIASELIEMDFHTDREVQIFQNAGKVLHVAERLIRENPGQWSMSLPVWPETMGLVPN